MSGNEPTPPPAFGDDQPTVPVTPAEAQPTAVYPPAGPPFGAAQPPGPDTRPRSLAWIALGAGLVGLVLALVGFIPVAGVGLVFALLGSIFLLAALIIGIVALVSKKHGGTGLAIGAIVVSVVGGTVVAVALVWSLVLFGLSATGSSTGTTTEPIPVPSTTHGVTEETDEPADGDASPADEAAYVALVRPQITELMQEVQPGITEEIVETVYSDEMLIATGTGFLMGGDAVREAFVQGVAQSGDLMTPEQAARFADIIIVAAEQYLR